MGDGLMNTEKFINKWEKKRQKGKFKYIIVAGVVIGLSGLTGFTISTLIFSESYHKFSEYNKYSFLISFMSGFLGGICGAEISWDRYEEKYNNLVNSK